MRALSVAAVLGFAAAAAACDGASGPTIVDVAFASEVVFFDPGEGAGFGQDALPDVVLGAPQSPGSGAGSLDVLALGDGGEVVVGFGAVTIVDREGPDFVVFENPFLVNADATHPFAEPGEVSVSADGEEWTSFPCDPVGDGDGSYPGCAGWRTVEPFDVDDVETLDPSLVGGDPFDLADIGVARARYVRIVDVSGAGWAPSVGFDLDALGVIHGEIGDGHGDGGGAQR